jgi:hypothetical protein
LNLLLDNYLSRSFSNARTQKNLLLKNVLLIEAPWGIAKNRGTTST